MIAAVLAVLLGAVDPCAAPAPADGAPRDPGTAAVYREVANQERARGALDTAATAYRKALEADPSDAAARAGLAQVCSARRERPPAPDAFAEGVRLMDAGDCRRAAELFAAARQRTPADASAALLEGICRYDLGEDAAAERSLRVAETDPQHRDSARVYLGLLALRRGAMSDAAARFDSVSDGAPLAPLAANLARAARRDGRVVLGFTAESAWDSNVNLGPGSSLGPSAQSDAAFAVNGWAVWRPAGQQGPYLRAIGSLREQARLGAYDLGGADGAAGWQWIGRRGWAVAEYDFAYRTLAGDTWLTAHRGLVNGAVGVAGWALGGMAFVRHDGYAGVYDPFTGVVAGGELRASRLLTPRARATFAYALAHSGARTATLAYLEHGPRLELTVDATRRVRVAAAVAWAWRGYESFDAALGVRRDDDYLDGSILAEWEFSPRWTARAGISGRHASSNVPEFAYSKIVPTVALGYVLGL